jgi:hypothetical protein
MLREKPKGRNPYRNRPVITALLGNAGCGDAVGLKVHLKVLLKVMPDSTIEIINGREGRRRWGVEEKLRISP